MHGFTSQNSAFSPFRPDGRGSIIGDSMLFVKDAKIP